MSTTLSDTYGTQGVSVFPITSTNVTDILAIYVKLSTFTRRAPSTQQSPYMACLMQLSYIHRELKSPFSQQLIDLGSTINSPSLPKYLKLEISSENNSRPMFFKLYFHPKYSVVRCLDNDFSASLFMMMRFGYVASL